MCETPRNEIKFGSQRPRFPATDSWKKRNFLNFPIFEDIRYHYYLIYTWFTRRNGGEFNEALFHFFFSLHLYRFWGTGGQLHTPRHVSLGAFFYLSILQKTPSGTLIFYQSKAHIKSGGHRLRYLTICENVEMIMLWTYIEIFSIISHKGIEIRMPHYKIKLITYPLALYPKSLMRYIT